MPYSKYRGLLRQPFYVPLVPRKTNSLIKNKEMIIPKKFPNDEDGQVLKMLYKQGVDFNEPQDVEFFIAVPDKQSGEAVLKSFKDDGLICELEQDDETEEWTCYCLMKMLLNYEEIIDIQKRLDGLSIPYGGQTDGWGVMID